MKNRYIHHPVLQGSPEWHAFRVGRITASVAAACVGQNPWCSPQKAYRMILGEEEHVSNWYMEHGREMEPVVVTLYELGTGNLCTKTGFWEHKDFPGIGASPDRLVMGGGLLEVKVSAKDKLELPIYWRIQAMVQLLCTGQDWCDVCWYKDGQIKTWRVDRAGIDDLAFRLMAFRDDYIIPRIQPGRKEVIPWVLPGT